PRHAPRTHPLSDIGIHQVRKTVAQSAWRHEQHFGRHFEIVEDQLALRNPAQAQRRLALADDQSLGGVELGMAHEDESADALLGAALVEHPRKNQVQSRYSAARDPMLPAIEEITVPAPVRASRHLRRAPT